MHHLDLELRTAGGTLKPLPKLGIKNRLKQVSVRWCRLLGWLKDEFTGCRAIMVKEWLEVIEDRFALLIILAIACQIFIYGNGISFDVRDVDTVVFDQERRPQSQTVLNQLLATGYFRIKEHVSSRSEVVQA